MSVKVPANIYVQQSADYSLPHPGQGYTGWQKIDIPVNPEKTAIIVMHAWYIPPFEECPGQYRMCEYIPRADKIMEEKMPAFLDAARKAGIRIIHVGSLSEKSLSALPGYRRVCEKYPEYLFPRIEHDEETKALWDFHWSYAHCNAENAPGFAVAGKERDFKIRPLDSEDVVCTTNQLFGLCCEYGITHLIYTGFCINWCLTYSPCGLIDMNRHGIMCSAVGDLVTAVENK